MVSSAPTTGPYLRPGAYDALYTDKDYAAEALAVRDLVRARADAEPQRWLDLACGTGRHLEHWAGGIRAVGLDIDPALLAIAAERVPTARFVESDLADFTLDEHFDVVTCMFSSIAYVATLERLRLALRTIAAHLAPGGTAVIEPWWTPSTSDALAPTYELRGSDGEYTIVGLGHHRIINGVSNCELHCLVDHDGEITHHVETHALALFTPEQYVAAATDAGLVDVTWDGAGLTGRGLLVGTRSS
jgi:SAM-dependent methyltransferase